MKRKQHSWQADLSSSINHPEQIDLGTRKIKQIEKVVKTFPLRIPRHILQRIDFTNPRCPIGKQAIPDIKELDSEGTVDPLLEEAFRIEPGIIQRFDDRLLALVSATCPLLCRHCNRKRYWKRPPELATAKDISRALARRKKVKEVILSGGDPLMLSNRVLNDLLNAARSAPQVELVRIHSRIPFSLPSRIEPSLIKILKRHRPLWFLTQFNHIKELSSQSRQALTKIIEAGIPVLNQAVLLRGINDSVKAQLDLCRALVATGVKPHYLFQLDRACGTLHFQVSDKRALEIIDRLQRNYSGLLIPRLMIDLPGKEGKLPLLPYNNT
jgi:lysine 2,3-aminomutase